MKLEDKNCDKCKRKTCYAACFNAHPGSIIALGKLLEQKGVAETTHVVWSE